MSLSVGIVGLPNVGKSTLFNALLKRQAALAANYPFATIEPNVGIVPVPDVRLALLARVVAGVKLPQEVMAVLDELTSLDLIDNLPAANNLPPIKPATVEFVDIAGLVAGASRGEGLGNKFLAHIRETDLIVHVLRDFEAENVIREGAKDPVSDLGTIRLELILADLSTLEKQKPPKGTKDKAELARWQVIEEFKQALAEEKMLNQLINQTTLSEKKQLMRQVAKELGLITAKAELFVVNVDETKLPKGVENLTQGYASQLKVDKERVLVMSNQVESELSALDEVDQKLYLEDLGLQSSGLSRLIQAAYRALNLQSFLTAGEKEVKAWTIPIETPAARAAGVIHTDFEKRFIKAQVISWREFVKLGGWKPARELGKVRQEGKDYFIKDGEVVEFMIGS